MSGAMVAELGFPVNAVPLLSETERRTPFGGHYRETIAPNGAPVLVLHNW